MFHHLIALLHPVLADTNQSLIFVPESLCLFRMPSCLVAGSSYCRLAQSTDGICFLAPIENNKWFGKKGRKLKKI